jgi:N-acetylmuramic acid 6-phosphate etherase
MEKRTSEQPSRYDNLDKMTTLELLRAINAEDRTVPEIVAGAIPRIEELVEGIVERVSRGGRVFYLGAGTSGRLGIVDASEIRPTYGVDNLFIGMMAGGDDAIRSAAEGAEDSRTGGWKDMQAFSPNENDVLIGIAASGTTPYVVGAVEEARRHRLLTGCITCNDNSPLAAASEIPVEVVVGPEFVTGSTRMKAGTAEKLVLNMISTASMIRLGHVKGNKMVDMQLTNTKLMDRGTRMIMDETGIKDYDYAHSLLLAHGSVRAAITSFQSCPTDSSHPTQP